MASGCPPCGVVELVAAVTEREDRGGEAMEVVTSAHRTDLAGREETGHSVGPEGGTDRQHVVIRRRESGGAPTVAREEQRTVHRRQGTRSAHTGEGVGQVDLRRSGISELEADRTADIHNVAHQDRAGLAVRPDEPAYEEVPLLMPLGVLI